MRLMEFHEATNIFPLMNAEEYTALKADIAAHGLREPIWTFQNHVVDGRNRLRACTELKIEPRFREWNGKGSLVDFIVSQNLHRRHLTSGQRAMVAVEVEKLLAVEAKERQRQHGDTAPGRRKTLVQKVAQVNSGRAVDQAAKLTRTNRKYVQDAKKLRATAPALAEQVKQGKLTIPQAKKKVKSAEREQARRKLVRSVHLPPDETMGILAGKFQEIGRQVADNSVALVFVDPPYDKDSTAIYGDLAEFAARVLVPGGSLIVYAQQHALPEIFALMTPHLKFWWPLALVMPGAQARLQHKKVRVAWKPLLWFTKGDYAGENYLMDVIDNKAAPAKVLHRWEQSIVPAHYCIEQLTRPGDLVVDPMAGSGTTCVAAAELGRRYVEIEKDPATVLTARARLRAMVPEQGVV